jgi:phage terminase large subunit-like protein
VAGKVTTNRLIRAACARHLSDLKSKAFRFDRTVAESAIQFFSKLPHTKGRQWSGKPFILEPWQQFIVGSLFGWLRPDGLRRFRVAFVEIPRGSGKSTLAAGVGLRLAFFDGEATAEVYSLATKREQARIVWDEAKRMVERTPGLKSRIQANAGNLFQLSTSSKFQPLGADADTLDGLRTHGAVIDELHAHKTRSLVDVIDTSTGTRLQPLVFEVTTAGFDRQSICYQHHDYSVKVLDGVFDDPTWFAFIAGIDEGDDWREEATWRKANPNYGVSVLADDLRRKAKKAMRVPADQNAFRRLHLNEWTEQEDRWLDIADWQACGDEVDAHDGDPCWVGMDLASTGDLAGYALVFDRDGAIDVMVRGFIPEAAMKKRSEIDRVPYDAWVNDGLLTATPGNVIDFEFIRAKLHEDAERFEIREIAYDPWNATQLVTQLGGDGFTCVPVRQGFISMSAPTKLLEKLVLSGKLRHGNHPVLGWCASNVAIDQDAAGNMKPSKKLSREKIDLVVALVMGVDRWSRHVAEPETQDYVRVLSWG